MFQRPARRWAHALSVTGAMTMALSLAGSGRAQATETVYRCGQTYQAEPCPGGKAVAVGDARDETARREAQGVAQREAQAAQQLRMDRLKREQAAATAKPRATGPAVVAHSAAEVAARPSPAASASTAKVCHRKSGLRSPAVGGCREEMVYTAPGSHPKVKKTKAERRQTSA